MIRTDVPDFPQAVEIIKKANQSLLVDVLVGILRCTIPFLQNDPSCPAAFRESISEQLSKLTSGEESVARVNKPVVKAKAPPRPKKKPPPQKKPPPGGSKESTALSKRYALFWAPTAGDPPSFLDSSEGQVETVAPFLNRAADIFDVEVPSLKEMPLPATTVFHSSLIDDEGYRLIEAAVRSSDLDVWFERQKRAPVVVKAAPKQEGARRSVLGTALAQRVCILTHCLKKGISSRATLSDVKAAMLNLSLGKDGIDLLIDMIPPDDETRRGESEWGKGAKAVAELIENSPDEELTEDEAFIHFLEAIPQLRQRLQCMFIIAAFDKIVSDLESKLEQLVDGLSVLVNNKSVHLTWHMLLALGNALNEGTTRGGLKWFKTQALRRALDVRGNKGMTLMDYIAIFTGPVVDTSEWRTILRAKDSGPLQVYVVAKNVLDTYLMMLGGQSDEGTLLPKPLDSQDPRAEGLVDEFLEKVQAFATENLPTCRRFLSRLLSFIQSYSATAYFFADAGTLLPLEKGVDGDAESDEHPGKDIFMRIHPFLAQLRAQAGTMKVKELAELGGYSWVGGRMMENSEGGTFSGGRGSAMQSSSPDLPTSAPAKATRVVLPSGGAPVNMRSGPPGGVPLPMAGGSKPYIIGMRVNANGGAAERTIRTPTNSGTLSHVGSGAKSSDDEVVRHTPPGPALAVGSSQFAQRTLASAMSTPYDRRYPSDSYGGSAMPAKTPLMSLGNRMADGNMVGATPLPGGRTPPGGVALPGLSFLGSQSVLPGGNSTSTSGYPQPLRPRDVRMTALPGRGLAGSRVLGGGIPQGPSHIPSAPQSMAGASSRLPNGMRSEIPSGLPKIPKPPGTANRFRFGFGSGTKGSVDPEALKRLQERLKQSEPIRLEAGGPSMGVDGVTIATPAMPSGAKRRNPRSSIDATFNFARDIAR